MAKSVRARTLYILLYSYQLSVFRFQPSAIRNQLSAVRIQLLAVRNLDFLIRSRENGCEEKPIFAPDGYEKRLLQVNRGAKNGADDPNRADEEAAYRLL